MRYVILVLLNAPIILLALFNIITQYKLKKVSSQRFRHQLFLWSLILIVLVLSFPLYNYITGNPILDSSELSLFDIIQTTAIIFLIYILKSQRQKNENIEKTLKELHQELSIKLSDKNGKS